MATLKKPYEISVWRDVPDDGTFKEQKIAIIGSNIMTSQYRAANPKLTRKINGANEFSFVLYRRYKNSINGKETINPFVELINNESKIKLLYDGEWYDFVIKDIQQDTSKHSITYTATDQHVNELSKNGYNLELADDLMNNSGNLQELAATVLADTDWGVDKWSDWPVQYLEETLIKLNEHKNGNDYTIYAFYSSCRSGAKRFQFIQGDLGLGTPNTDGVYDKCTQFYIDSPVYGATDNLGLALPQPGSYLSNDGTTYDLGTLTYYNDSVFTNKRANRIVYTHKSVYNPVLNKYVYEYNTAADLNGETIMGFSETEYITPNIVENYVTNNTFKSVSGWRGAVLTDSEKAIEKDKRITKPTCRVDAVRSDGSATLLDDLKNGVYTGTTYDPRLSIKISEAARDNQTCIVTNSGFYDCRTAIGNVKPNEKFVLIYRCAPTGQVESNVNPEFTVMVADYRYNTTDDTYHSNVKVGEETITKVPLLTFKCGSAIKTIKTSDETSVNYHYVVANVDSKYNLTEREFKNSKFQIFIETSSDLSFYDFQIFRFVQQENTSGNNNFVSPLDQAVEAKAVTKYYYYDPKKNSTDPTSLGYVSAQQDYKWFVEPTTDPLTEEETNKLYPVYTELRYHSVQISKSNYFNAIQELCEKFECWAKFEVPHDDQGGICSGKHVRFYTDVGKTNYAGFRYGINLKSSKRTMDSKAFVSKLIVPDNVSEAADNGYCTISTAKANPSGENYILNFSYYINQGMMDGEYLHEFLYRPKTIGDLDDLQGYYHQLRALNDTITEYSELYSALVAPLSQAEADLQTAEAGYTSAAEKLEDAETTFLLETGCAWDDIGSDSTLHKLIFGGNGNSGDSKLLGYLTEIAEYKTAAQKYQVEESRAKAAYEFYKGLNDTYYNNIQEATAAKDTLTKAFYNRYSRFIQEGTWTDSTYIDNDTYYTDALATSYNSCQPQVTYTFDVVDLSALEGYESLNFRLGDLTWVEDPELFGNARESVVITELTYSLDAPDKNTIKVQNYRNQFADLFQKMTATTQTVQYSSAAWERAGNFTGSSAMDQAAFLQDALESAELVLKNSGEQSVVWDKTGITVTDNDSPNKQIRIVGGAIMLRDEDGDGLGWKVGITSSGINAKLITAGQVDTGVVRIMNGNDNLFRWDKSGINAYDYTSSEGYNSVDTKRGVRFDKFGIYGYDLNKNDDGLYVDPESWVPSDTNEIRKRSSFALTWDGLHLNLGTGKYYRLDDIDFKSPIEHNSSALLGYTDGYIYNTIIDGVASYEAGSKNKEFTKILSVKNDDDTETVALYDNGAIVLRGAYLSDVRWAKDSGIRQEKERKYYYYCEAKVLTEGQLKDVSWSEAIKIPAMGEYQYIKTVITYSDDSTETFYSSSASGSKGEQGDPGSNGAQGPEGPQGEKGDIGLIGTEVTTVTIYCATESQLVAAPTLINGALDSGWTEEHPIINVTIPYLWACYVTKTTTYKYNEDKTEAIVNTIIYSNASAPHLIEAYTSNSAISSDTYATFLSLTNFGEKQGLSYNSDGDLYINASFINTGALTINSASPGSKYLFSADINTKKVYLSGFIATSYTSSLGAGVPDAVDILYYDDSSSAQSPTSFIIAPKGLWLEKRCGTTGDPVKWGLVLGNTFGVTTDGVLYATGANISGTVTAEEGAIGGWTLKNGGLNNGSSSQITPDGIIIAKQLQTTGICDFKNIISSSISTATLTATNIIVDKSISFSQTGLNLQEVTISSEKQDYSVRYSTLVNGKKCTVTAKIATAASKDLHCQNSITMYYPGLEAITEETKCSFEITIPQGATSGTVDIYGLQRDGFGDLEKTTEIKTIYTSVSNKYLGISNTYFTTNAIYFGSTIDGSASFAYSIYTAAGGISAVTIKGSFSLADGATWNTGSDRRLKSNITALTTPHDEFFDLLKPVSFSYRANSGTRFGFIAQDVLDACAAASIDSSKIVSTFIEDNTEYYSLSYTDIIALNTSQIQKLKCRIAELEAKVEELFRKFD